MDWGRVREKVVRVVRRLVHDTPELAGFLDLPGGMVKPHNVLPIGFGYTNAADLITQITNFILHL